MPTLFRRLACGVLLIPLLLAACGAPTVENTAATQALTAAATTETVATAELPTTSPPQSTSTAEPAPAPVSTPTDAAATVSPETATVAAVGVETATAATETAAGGVLPAPLLYLGGGPQAQSQIFRMERDGKTITQLTDEKPAQPDILAITEFDVSPADGSLAYVVQTAPGTAVILTDDQGENRRELVAGLNANYVRWSPDGKQLAIKVTRPESSTAGAEEGVYLVAPGDPELRLLQVDDPIIDPNNPSPEARGYEPVAWSPDGRQLMLNAFSKVVEICEVAVINLENGKLTTLAAPEGMTTACGSGAWSSDGKAIYVRMTNPGLSPPIPGLWRADPATGETTPFIPSSPAEGTFTLATGAHAGRDGSVYAFLGTTNKIPDVGGDPSVDWPEFAMSRVSVDAAQTEQLRDETYENPGETVLWAPDDSGAVIGDFDVQTGSSTLFWLPVGDEPSVDLGVSSTVLHWGIE